MAVERWVGFQINEVLDAGDNVISGSIDVAEIVVTFPDDGGTLSYVLDTPGDPNSTVTFTTDATSIDYVLNGVSQGDIVSGSDAQVQEITWTDPESGQTFTAQILSIDIPGGPFAIFQLGGDPIPAFSTYEEFALFNDGIDTVGPVTDPALAPGETFTVQDLPNTQEVFPGTPGVTETAGDGGETLVGGANDDTLIGGLSGDRLDGGEGGDSISGGDGNDQILGRIGGDILYGGEGDDTIAAADGNDQIYGGNGNDSLGGSDGDDRMYGGEGNDIMGAGNQNDWLEGNNGHDTMSGGAGSDSVYGGAGNDQMAGSYGNDTVDGGDGNDDMGGGFGVDYMYAGAGDDLMGAGDHNDFVFGGSGNDFLGGGSGNDMLYGGTGADRLNGGQGNDTLTGGADADRFIFNAYYAGERDVITDFQDGVDRFQVHGLTGTRDERFAQISVTNTAGGALIEINGQEILVQGVAASSITADDFIFVL